MTKLMVLLGFAVSFSAGVMVGVVGDRRPHKPEGKPERDRTSWLVEQLKLTPEQSKQMQEIWSELAKRGGREQGERRMQLRKQRDESIAALIPEERRGDYERVLSDFAAANEALENEWRSAYQTAVERTKAMLTSEQRERYEQLLSRQGWGGPGPGPRERGRGSTRPHDGPPPSGSGGRPSD